MMLTMERPGHYALRRGRFSQPGMQYLVTVVTYKRRPLFADLACARAAVRAIRYQHTRARVQSFCHVLMPDHLHWLFELGEEKSLSDLMRDFKGYTARTINKVRWNRTGSVWQTGFHDHALRANEDAQHLSRYVIRNPMRAGLVQNLRDYPHWDASWFRPEQGAPMEAALLGL